jgi:G3E family GTPase
LKQVAFADRIVLNKIDLVKSHELRKLEDWIQSVNPTAKVHTAIQSDVPIDFVFDVGGFALVVCQINSFNYIQSSCVRNF